MRTVCWTLKIIPKACQKNFYRDANWVSKFTELIWVCVIIADNGRFSRRSKNVIKVNIAKQGIFWFVRNDWRSFIVHLSDGVIDGSQKLAFKFYKFFQIPIVELCFSEQSWYCLNRYWMGIKQGLSKGFNYQQLEGC